MTPPVAPARRLAAAALVALGLCLPMPVPAAAQALRLQAGEHRGFTRLVVLSAGGFAWSLSDPADGETAPDPAGRTIRLDLPGRRPELDRRALFRRIPRTRLADISLAGDGLNLRLACPCPVAAWLERPGVLVIDIRDAGPAEGPRQAAAVPPRGAGGAAVSQPETARVDPARAAGLALARSRRGADPDPAGGFSAAPTPAAPWRDRRAGSPAVLPTAADLAPHLSRAMGQGLAQPDIPGLSAGGPLAAAAPAALPPLPANIRLRDPDSPANSGVAGPAASCPSDEALAFARASDPPAFSERLATLRSALYGEFDQPVEDMFAALVQHYLAWGFGAEARALADRAATLPEGIVLMGVADILEGRSSNARQRLSTLIDCPGAAGLFALLAGGEGGTGARHPETIAAAFAEMPPALRGALGPDLVGRLAAQGALEAARIVQAAAERVAGEPATRLTVAAAVLDRARGEPGRAEGRLAQAAGRDLEALVLDLELALEGARPAPAARREAAVVLAEGDRTGETGRRAMELAIRHAALAQDVRSGLELLDRFTGWLDPTPSSLSRVAQLRDSLWSAAVGLADRDLVALVLERSDWRDPALSAATAVSLAERLGDLGLARPDTRPVLPPTLPNGSVPSTEPLAGSFHAAATPAPRPAILPPGQAGSLRGTVESARAGAAGAGALGRGSRPDEAARSALTDRSRPAAPGPDTGAGLPTARPGAPTAGIGPEAAATAPAAIALQRPGRALPADIRAPDPGAQASGIGIVGPVRAANPAAAPERDAPADDGSAFAPGPPGGSAVALAPSGPFAVPAATGPGAAAAGPPDRAGPEQAIDPIPDAGEGPEDAPLLPTPAGRRGTAMAADPMSVSAEALADSLRLRAELGRLGLGAARP